MKKILVIVCCLFAFAAKSQIVYVPSNLDSLRIAINVNGMPRLVYGTALKNVLNNHYVQNSSGARFGYRAITAATTIVPATDYFIHITSGTFSQPLPTASAGQTFVIKNTSGNTINITPPAGTIDTFTDVDITSGNSVTFVSTGQSTGITYIMINNG